MSYPFENRMQQYYAMQPEALRQVASGADTILSSLAEPLHGFVPSRVLLIGIGSSFHAANMAVRCFFEVSGIRACCLTPEQILMQSMETREHVLAIAVSQSGTSSNTLRAMEACRKAGFVTSVITQNTQSLIANACDLVLPLLIPEENAGPKTMGVVGTVATLLIIAAALGKQKEAIDAAVAEIRSCERAMEENLVFTRDWVLGQAETLCQASSWIVVGQRAAHAPAGESALKIVETIRRVTAVYELEEIVHGPHASFLASPHMLALSLPQDPPERLQALCNSLKAQGGQAFSVTLHASSASSEGEHLFLRQSLPMLSPLQLLLPAQAMSAWIAPRLGIDLDQSDENPFTRILAGHLDA